MKKFLLIVSLFASAHASADQWVGPFTITNLYVSGSTNFHYRTMGMPTVSACASAPTWAYVNEADPGAKGYIAALLMAFAAGKQVTLYVQPTNGYCHILEINVTG